MALLWTKVLLDTSLVSLESMLLLAKPLAPQCKPGMKDQVPILTLRVQSNRMLVLPVGTERVEARVASKPRPVSMPWEVMLLVPAPHPH